MSPVRTALGDEAIEAQGFRRLLVLDAALLLWARGCETHWLTGLMRALTGLGNTATCLMLALVLTFLGGQGDLAWVFFPVAGGIGASRVYLGAHYPLDVAVGAMLGLGCGLLVRGPLDAPLGLAWNSLAAVVGLVWQPHPAPPGAGRPAAAGARGGGNARA